MFKTVFTLVRGAATAAEGELLARNALLILEQQIRDAASAVEGGKRALAVETRGQVGRAPISRLKSDNSRRR